ncbi:MAG: tryptophan--tRNA ligase [Candidatus Moraniibacteriota bacterium]|nr:MAG: tryptophan--tRNA ligase [Candidatus Moranbacteria bacterium]
MQRLFSGIQPSGNLHLGNYLGAIKQWLALQDEYEAIFCVVDMHAITVPQDPSELRKKTIEIAKIYLAAGIDPKKSTLFIQSQISGHAQLAWVLNTITQNGDLMRMTQFKSKSGVDLDRFQEFFDTLFKDREALEEGAENYKKSLASHKSTLSKRSNSEGDKDLDIMDQVLLLSKEIYKDGAMNTFNAFKEGFQGMVKEPFNSIGVGLFDYPVLMAADILLYDAAVVPVGEDQKQHVELTRDLAQRFNSRFGETFVVPEPLIQREGARIMGFDDPTKKMSKSAASEYNSIALSDDADTIRKKIKKAVTDSGSEIVYRDDKPALKNLINIYTLLSGKKVDEVEAMYVGRGYGDFKAGLAEVIVDFLVPFQARLAAISDEAVLEILAAGREKAKALAVAKMRQVHERVGFIPY